MQRFVDASIIGWYNYLYGDNKAANDLIKKDNPGDDRRADRLLDRARSRNSAWSTPVLRPRRGIGCMTDAQVKDFYDKMVKAKVVKAGLDYQEDLYDRVRLQEVGMDLKK